MEWTKLDDLFFPENFKVFALHGLNLNLIVLLSSVQDWHREEKTWSISPTWFSSQTFVAFVLGVRDAFVDFQDFHP